jgi:predicted nucleic-acid-binding Zn-ribbon protein
MSEQTPPEIKCPKCGSNQFVAGKKGFSGKKAVAGAVLTGGIGLLAGTIGSNKIKITCLNCGHVYQPGDSVKAESDATAKKEQLKNVAEEDKDVVIIIQEKGALMATKFYKEHYGVTLVEAQQKVTALQKKYDIKDPNQIGQGGCIFLLVIAAAVIVYYFWTR